MAQDQGNGLDETLPEQLQDVTTLETQLGEEKKTSRRVFGQLAAHRRRVSKFQTACGKGQSRLRAVREPTFVETALGCDGQF